MNSSLENDYNEIFEAISRGNSNIVYLQNMREFAIKSVTKGVIDIIYFCPFSGKKLPLSLRDQFFDLVESLGKDYLSGDELPDEFNSEHWWIERGL